MICDFRPHCSVLSSLLAASLLLGAGCKVGDPDAKPDPDASPPSNIDASTPPPPPPTGFVSIAGGTFAPLPGYEEVAIHGGAHILRSTDGKTKIEVHLEGLTASAEYPIYVRSLPCNVDPAGSYVYTRDRDPNSTLPPEQNELRTTGTADANGIARANIEGPELLRADAQSIVVQDPAVTPNANMICANFVMPKAQGPVAYAGSFAPFPNAATQDITIAGTATMQVRSMETRIDLTVTGLTAGTTYNVHVHELPCGAAKAGGHYKIDPTIAGAIEENELWPTLVPDPNTPTSATASYTSTHSVRADAQSVVIHRAVAAGMAPKVACADLVRESYVDFTTDGTAVRLTAGEERYPTLAADASLVRGLDGKTRGSLTVSNLGIAMSYDVHVHTLTCASNNGGGHYKIDTTVEGAVEENELWLNITTDGTGSGTVNAIEWAHMARPEALSVVIHDNNETKDRLACIDLK